MIYQQQFVQYDHFPRQILDFLIEIGGFLGAIPIINVFFEVLHERWLERDVKRMMREKERELRLEEAAGAASRRQERVFSYEKMYETVIEVEELRREIERQR